MRRCTLQAYHEYSLIISWEDAAIRASAFEFRILYRVWGNTEVRWKSLQIFPHELLYWIKLMIFTARPWKQAVVQGIWRIRGFRWYAILRIVWWPMTKMPPGSPWNTSAIILNDANDFDILCEMGIYMSCAYLHLQISKLAKMVWYIISQMCRRTKLQITVRNQIHVLEY